MQFRAEVQELIDEVTGAAHAGEPWQERAHHIAREAFDVVGGVLNASDDPKLQDELTAELERAASVVVDKLMVSNPLARRIVKSSLPMVVPGIVAAAAKYTGTADDWIAANVLPELARLEDTVHRVRVALVG